MSSASSAPLAAPRLAPGRRALLSTMMFLQYAVWGAWFVVVGNYLLDGLHFGEDQIGLIIGTMALGTIFAPLFVGQIADRYFSSERLMGVLHLSGAVLLYAMASVTDFTAFFVVALIYALLYSPTLVLSNSITFAHVPDGGRDFPRIRVFGTIGWIVANLIVGQVLSRLVPNAVATNAPLLLGAGFSLALGVFSFFLPHTPPAGKSGDAFPALRAIGLLRSPSFAVFFGVSFVITIVLAFYYTFTSIYLTESTLPAIAVAQADKTGAAPAKPPAPDVELPQSKDSLIEAAAKLEAEAALDRAKARGNVEVKVGSTSLILDAPTVMTIGQFAEMILLPFLPWFLRKMGMKWVLAMGMAAWGVRYLLFALGAQGSVNPWVVIASLALHGVCFDFFFAAGFIYVDNEAPNEIRASGQALFTFLTYGLGMWLGNIISGFVAKAYTTTVYDWSQAWLVPTPVYNWYGHWLVPYPKVIHDWYHIWMIPSIGVLASLVVFALFFRVERKQAL